MMSTGRSKRRFEASEISICFGRIERDVPAVLEMVLVCRKELRTAVIGTWKPGKKAGWAVELAIPSITDRDIACTTRGRCLIAKTQDLHCG